MTDTEENKGYLGIIGAMQIEVEELIAHMTDCTEQTVSGITFTEGILRGRRTVVARCGVGKVFAALCAQTMILLYHPEVIINTGVAGSLTDRLGIGQVAVADAVIQHDMDTSGIGDPVGLISTVNRMDFPTARQALAEGAELCDTMRETMSHLLRTADYTELEAALRAADGYLEQQATEDALGELRRAQVEVERLEWLARRLV